MRKCLVWRGPKCNLDYEVTFQKTHIVEMKLHLFCNVPNACTFRCVLQQLVVEIDPSSHTNVDKFCKNNFFLKWFLFDLLPRKFWVNKIVYFVNYVVMDDKHFDVLGGRDENRLERELKVKVYFKNIILINKNITINMSSIFTTYSNWRLLLLLLLLQLLFVLLQLSRD